MSEQALVPSSKHPQQEEWTADEERLRASYVATREQLVPYLVPHRYESRDINGDPKNLRRSRYGYGIALNRSWLSELMGHIRTAETRYFWGPLEEVAQDRETEWATGRPDGGMAMDIYDDATLTGEPLVNFFERRVLEWMLSSVGGFVLVDIPSKPEDATVAEEQAMGQRPFFRFVPMSQVVDLGTGGRGFGFRWIEVTEREDNRNPLGTGEAGKIEDRRVLYRIEGRRVTAQRRDKEGRALEDPRDLGEILDRHGNPCLPLIPAFFGEHPDIEFIGSGLIYDLADIVVDLFNRMSETVEGFRDGAFGFLAYQGDQWDDFKSALEDGSRAAPVGKDGSVERVAAGAGEVDAGLSLIEVGVKAWALGAKRKAQEAMESAVEQSGVARKAEFQLDSRPLLTEITETLDEVQTNALWVAAQLAGITPEAAEDIAIKRDTEFQMEDEASRISRIVGEFLTALPLPALAVKSIILRFLEASKLVDMDDPETREQVEAQADEIAEAEQSNRAARGDFLRSMRSFEGDDLAA